MENKVCEFCHKEIEENYNFCPYCGEALSDLAVQIKEKQLINAQLKLVFNLLDKVTDEKTITLLQEFVEEAKKKM